MNTKQVGEISETAISLRLLKLGKSVSRPIGDNQRYDLVVDVDGKFQRLQVKTARIKKGCLVATTSRSTGKKGGKYVKSAYTIDEIDGFAIYAPELDKCYFVPISDKSQYEITLRLEAPANNQTKDIRWAKDFEL
jgi:hypothetical protein